ncbi:retroviral-like aspartic protease family protein [Tenacibaculum sp. nBUS_03]|uniref:retroviral-like aspartic protease family protein n=1 Tax=Tenacibaculum sp. nBUS_03 TaxID=3395320 RepID=UPI003EBBD480
MKTIKKIGILILSSLIFSPFAYGQENNEYYKKAIDSLEKGLQESNYTSFQKSLSNTFKTGSYEQPLVSKVIPQILTQYPPLNSLKIVAFKNNIATIEYLFNGMEKQVSEVYFNSEGKITKIELFDAILKASAASQNTSQAELIDSFTTKFELVNNLIFVKVVLNGKEEYFILDSGAPTIVLNSTYFESKESNETAKGVSGSAALQNIEIESFDWNGITFKNTELIGMDLSHLEEKTGRKFKGLIGFSILQNYELFIDYKKSELSLFSEGNSKWHTQVKPKTEFSFEYGAHIPVIKTVINNKQYKFGLDTGASSNLISLPSFAVLPKKSYKQIETSKLVGADKNVTEVSVINIKNCTISNTKFKKMEFVTSDISHLTQGYGFEIDGLIGYPFLSEQKTSIDFLNQKMYFW